MVEQAAGPVGVTTHYIIEHFEEELSDWTLSEYVNMLLSLNRLYDTVERTVPHKEILVITNFPFIAKHNKILAACGLGVIVRNCFCIQIHSR